MNPYPFQQQAIEQLTDEFKRLWAAGHPGAAITFKSPTGSGKTFMVESFVHGLTAQPDWQADVAFVWATFSDELAMQSHRKYADYFHPNLHNRCLTLADATGQGILKSGELLFLNWQKLVSRRAEDRVLRRPDDELLRKESGSYFEDVVEATHAAGRAIVLIIDESHEHVTTAAERDVIRPLQPRIVLKVSATPEEEPKPSDINAGRAAYVEVPREEVVREGCIAAEVVCQTEEDLRRHTGTDLDTLLLDLAIERQADLSARLQAEGIDVRPLVLIQLPNDRTADLDVGVKQKETIVSEYLLHHKQVRPEEIAYWFDRRKENMEGIERDDSPVRFLLFKVAASTGWDCPRAQVLVMYRDIKNPTFQTQVIGRIIRIPRCGKGNPIFATSYLYTNFSRQDIHDAPTKSENKLKLFTAVSRKGTALSLDPHLLTDHLPRVDYGDLGSVVAFQRHLNEQFCQFFHLPEVAQAEAYDAQLEAHGLKLNVHLERSLMTDARFANIDALQQHLIGGDVEGGDIGHDVDYEISRHDVELLFNATLVALLREQTDERAKVGNVARAWSPLKSALRLWMTHYLHTYDTDAAYRIFLNDIGHEANSVFRRVLTQTLSSYRPKLEKALARRGALQQFLYELPASLAFSDDYEALDMKRSLYTPFFLRRDYDGQNTEAPFARFLDVQENIDWWHKNGDSGKENLAFVYTYKGKQSLFFPDWVVRFTDGRIGIFDTKEGQTAESGETEAKAAALHHRLQVLNGYGSELHRYVGGIVVKENGLWYVHPGENYDYTSGRLSAEWRVWDF